LNKKYELKNYGWDEYFEACFAEYASKGLHAARVAVEHRNYYELYSEFGELTAEKSGKLFYSTEDTHQLPAVGDWVVIKHMPDEKKGVITDVLPRKTKFSRKKAGSTTEEQIVAANVDTVFIISSLNQDLNMRRMERYMALAWDNNVKPVILLSKADLCEEVYAKLVEVQDRFAGVDVHIVSALQKAGLDDLLKFFEGNKTIAVIGSSGVGKSTLINGLLDWEKMEVSEIGLYKDKGRHTTTHRELTVVPGGGLIIDTPGMREIQMWEGAEGLSELFEDIEKLIVECKFSDCKHESEPGCAVKAAIKKGELDEERFKSYKKLLSEVSYFERKQDKKAQIEEKKKWKKISQLGKQIGNEKRK
jgi:ribosome biogenesis GTPase